MIGHGIESVFNNGWEDDPNWKVVCECGWETWNNATEEAARVDHTMHTLGSGQMGRDFDAMAKADREEKQS